MEIGERIRQRRNACGLTLRELAAKVNSDLTHATISRYENGEISVSLENARRIAEALGVPPAYLVGWQESAELPAPPAKATVAQKIRHYVDNVAQVSRKQLAQNLGKTESYVSLVLSGKRKMDIDEYVALCRVLAVKPTRFLEDD